MISYFPLIVRVHLPANVNKMLTEKKDRRREGKFEAWEKTKAQPVRAGQIGDLQSSVLTAPLIRLLHIILYRCKVINAKAAAVDLDPICMGILWHTLYSGKCLVISGQ